MSKEFVNEPLSDFGDAKTAARMEEALERVHGELGRDYPLIVGGEKIATDAKITSIDPSDPDHVVGRASKATAEVAQQAIDVARSAFAEWRNVSAEARARYLFDAAGKRKHQSRETPDRDSTFEREPVSSSTAKEVIHV